MTRPGAVLVLALILSSPVRGDVLHLRGGGTIAADSWRIEGDHVIVESEAGVVSLPRREVVRIEATAPSGGSEGPIGKAATGRAGAGGGGDERDDDGVGALMEQGVAALRRRDFDTASARFLEVVRLQPDLGEARVGYAVSEMALDRDGLALSVVLDGLVRHPEDPRLHEVKGDLMNREERVEDALAAWRQAFRLTPNDRVRDKILKGERELEAGRYYTFSTTPHFNVRYDNNGLDTDLAAEITDLLEEKYWELSSSLRHSPPQPITVLLYPMREFRDVTQAPEWVGGLYDGKIRVPLGGITRLDARAEAVLAHELTHAVIHSKTRGSCPRWLHEGLAQRFEGRSWTRAERREVLDLIRGIDPADWESRGFSYPAAHSLVIHLETRRGREGLVRLLDRLGEGAAVDDALIEVYGQDYAALCRGWARALDDDEERR